MLGQKEISVEENFKLNNVLCALWVFRFILTFILGLIKYWAVRKIYQIWRAAAFVTMLMSQKYFSKMS